MDLNREEEPLAELRRYNMEKWGEMQKERCSRFYVGCSRLGSCDSTNLSTDSIANKAITSTHCFNTAKTPAGLAACFRAMFPCTKQQSISNGDHSGIQQASPKYEDQWMLLLDI